MRPRDPRRPRGPSSAKRPARRRGRNRRGPTARRPLLGWLRPRGDDGSELTIASVAAPAPASFSFRPNASRAGVLLAPTTPAREIPRSAPPRTRAPGSVCRWLPPRTRTGARAGRAGLPVAPVSSGARSGDMSSGPQLGLMPASRDGGDYCLSGVKCPLDRDCSWADDGMREPAGAGPGWTGARL